MFTEKKRVSTGLRALDQRLDGLFIGDNVIWYDEAGSLAFPFALNFIQESQNQNKPLIYITFDRSPKSLLEELGPLAKNENLTIVDCFTHGKGDSSDVFSRFYETDGSQWPCRVVKVNEPAKPDQVSETIYGIHQQLKGDVRFVFESLTGMQELWEGEENLLKFYSRSCPRLYELDTIAYWIIEKGAHTHRLKAQINQIAQVAIELSIRRGKSMLSILKAHNRRLDNLDKPEFFWADGMSVGFDADRPMTEKIDLGGRLKSVRLRKGLSQKELAGLVGVTPSTISQIESNLIYPSLPALVKMAQVLAVETAFFFKRNGVDQKPVVFSGPGKSVHFPHLPKSGIEGWQLLPVDFAAGVDPYILEIPGGTKLPAHFFPHKGQEFGYLVEGQLEVTINNSVQTVRAGDVILLTRENPTQWKNSRKDTARLLWLKIL
ncbi:MAG: helix-turn-helix domain-containing protein [Desulfobacteraceae bacterium]|nr:MAG: helix-turn-helix domain-containing protein [Desulfobacteraceae bacterium]